MEKSVEVLAGRPFSRLWTLIVGVGKVGSWFSGWYGKIAAVFVFIAVVEAFLFAFWHFKRIRNFKTGWRQRLTPTHFSWVTKSSITMCMIEPVVVGSLILLCGICVAAMWPFWVLVVSVISTYDVIHYVIRKIRRRQTADDDDERFSFNKVEEFPWLYGDHDASIIRGITADAMLTRRTQNEEEVAATSKRRRNQKNKK